MAPLLLRNSINNDSTSHRKWSRLLFIHGCGRKMDLFIFNGDAITRLKNQSIGGGAVSGGPRNEIYWNQLNTMNDGALKKKKKGKGESFESFRSILSLSYNNGNSWWI